VGNIGQSDLTFKIEGNGGDSVKLLALTYGVDLSREYPNTKTAVSQYFQKYSLTELNTTNPAVLATALNSADVFLIPEQESGSPAVFSGFATVLQNYVNGGGSVIICGTDISGCVFNTGLLSGTYSGTTGGTVNIVDTNYAITKSVASTFGAPNATFRYNFSDVNYVSIAEVTGAHVVGFKPLGSGKVIFMGFDYYNIGNDAAKLIANSVEWAGGGVIPSWLSLSE